MISAMSILVGAIVGAVPSEAAESLPKAVPPQFGIAVIRENGDVEINYPEPKPVYETRTREVVEVVDGMRVVRKETYMVCAYFAGPAATKRVAGQFQVFQGGKQVAEETRAALLKEPVRVVFTEDPGPWPLDPFYLGFLREDVIVVRLNLQRGTPPPDEAARPSPLPGVFVPLPPLPR